jgi:hypothetical protein
LHRESKHHDDDQNAYNTQSLWHSVSSFYFEKFQTEEIDADFDDSVQNANENIEKDSCKECGIQEQLNVIEPLTV